jgi:TRAP-type C4-dicarboxylate transport system substrate-binding protein
MTRNFVDRYALVSIVLVCALFVFAVAPARAAGPLILRAGSSEPEGRSAPAMSIGKFCELATKLSNGELNVQPFYQSLGIEQQLASAIKAGSVDLGYTSSPNLAPFTDAFLLFDFPFLFKNDRAYIDVLENHPAGKKALAQFEKDLGVKVLVITSQTYDAEISGTNLETRNKQVKVPADIKGLKLRTSSTPVEIFLMKAYGANPTPIPYGQVYTALQQGVVDGNAATPLPASTSIRLFEVTKHYLPIGFRFNLLPIYINQKKFDSLTPSQQKALLDAAAQVKPLAGQWARDQVKASVAELEKAGVRIHYPTKEEMVQWTSVREKVWQQISDEFKGKIDLKVANEIYNMSPR